MKRIAAFLLLSLLALPALAGPSKNAAATASPGEPDWVKVGSDVMKDRLVSVGVGGSRVEAVAAALGELAKVQRSYDLVKAKEAASSQKIGDEERRVDPNTMKESAEAKFGSVSVSKQLEATHTEDLMETTTGGVEKHTAESDLVHATTKVVMKSGQKSFVVKVDLLSQRFPSSPERDRDQSKVEYQDAGLTIADVVAELKGQGIELRSWTDPSDDTHFVGLSKSVAPAP